VIDRASKTWSDRLFRDLPSFLRPGDAVVINDSKVFSSRLFGRKPGYAREVEIFLVRPLDAERRYWSALVRPGRHLHSGAHVEIAPGLSAEILETGVRGERRVPLPPYIHRPDVPADRDRYQTVYADKPGSVAAPTAGLHFTPEVMQACQDAGAEFARVALNVGLGTFQPLIDETVEQNHLHQETWEIPAAAAEILAHAKRRVAVGTTSVRTLETAVRDDGLRAGSGETDLFIYPGFEFQATDVLLTNFHLPKSSLLMLVCAFAGTELILDAYRHASAEKYRFFSYGDCMLIV
jgi:S-adenosylmethionine:tRNA ribosyltransferase-isomerase